MCTGVTATCRGLHPFNGISLLVLQTAGYLNPILEEFAKQAKPRVIGSLHTLRMRGKRGEVIIWLLRGPFGFSLDARVSTAYPSERRIERLPSKASSACPARVTSPGTSSLFRELVPSADCVSDPYSSKYAHVVSMQRLPLDPGQTGFRDLGFYSLMEISCKSLQGIPLGTPQIDAYLFTDSKCCMLGYKLTTSDKRGGLQPWKICTSMCWNCMWSGLAL